MKKLWHRLRSIRPSLSTRFILGMAAMVFITALASVLILNIIITNQARDLEARFQKTFTQIQDLRKQATPPTPQETLDRLKTILADTTTTPDEQLDRVRGALRYDGINYLVIATILRDSGLPVKVPPPYKSGTYEGAPPPSRDGKEGSNVRGVNFGAPHIETEAESYIFSPVVISFLLGSLLAAVCAVILGFFLSRTVIKPLRKLEQASERIADGNYSLEIKPEGKDDLGRLARSFNKMALALRQTETKRKELVADVAHELRTPLSSIQGYTEVLKDGLVPSRERQDEIYNHILKEVRHLSGLVESLRVWMSNEQALEHLNIEEVAVGQAAQMVIERFQPTADHKQVELELKINSATEPKVKTDPDALSHILSNLVDNALHYTAEEGKIRLNISAPTALKGDKQKVVWFEVQDNGRGIPAEHLPFVFERFYRVDKSRDRATGGSGLGLSIVRDTVQALGGEVQIESKVDQGTTVKFCLPAVVVGKPATSRKQSPVLVGSKA